MDEEFGDENGKRHTPHMNDDMCIMGISDHRPKKILKPLQIEDQHVTVNLSKLSTQRKIYRLIVSIVQNKKCDALFIHGAGILGLLSIIAGKLFNIPIIIRLGGDSWSTNNEKIRELWDVGDYFLSIKYCGLRLINEGSYRLCDGFIVVSKELKTEVVRNTKVPPRYIRIVQPPIEQPNKEGISKQDTMLKENNNVILTVTNLRFHGKFKGAKEAISLTEPLLAENKDNIHVVAGGGIFYEDLKRHVRENVPEDIQERIILPGFVDKVEALYEKSDVFLYISYEDAYPNVILEAQMASLPVISNEYDGHKEQITTGKTGIIINPENANQAKLAIEDLLNHPQKRKFLGNNAERVVSERNSMKAVRSKMEQEIYELLFNLEEDRSSIDQRDT